MAGSVDPDERRARCQRKVRDGRVGRRVLYRDAQTGSFEVHEEELMREMPADRIIQPFYGITYSVRTFAIVTAAGLGNLPGVIGAAFGIGLFEKYTGIIIGTAYEVAAPVSILLLVLIWRQISMRKNRQVVR